mmetsp:Transcript_37885/g.61396  ORF Transcript_37885/g.61396 Transcript_37885/m.61396 type:complete len:92 (+) Transcript_37885:1067-1342(+)
MTPDAASAYVDDTLFVQPEVAGPANPDTAAYDLAATLTGLPLAHEKNQHGKRVKRSGVWFDSSDMSVTLSPDKIKELVKSLTSIGRSRSGG